MQDGPLLKRVAVRDCTHHVRRRSRPLVVQTSGWLPHSGVSGQADCHWSSRRTVRLAHFIQFLAATPRRCGVTVASRLRLHIEHSIRGLNRSVAILLNMQSRSREANVTPRRRGVAAII